MNEFEIYKHKCGIERQYLLYGSCICKTQVERYWENGMVQMSITRKNLHPAELVDIITQIGEDNRRVILPSEVIEECLASDPMDKNQFSLAYKMLLPPGKDIVVDVAILPEPNGNNIKFVLGHQLYALSSNHRINRDGSLAISTQDYEAHEGLIVNKKRFGEESNLGVKIWGYLLQADTRLLREYRNSIKEKCKGYSFSKESSRFLRRGLGSTFGVSIEERNGMQLARICFSNKYVPVLLSKHFSFMGENDVVGCADKE